MGTDSKPKENIESATPNEEVDVLTQQMGSFGTWQLLLTFFLSLFNVTCTFHIFSSTFEGAQPDDFWCARPSNLKDLKIPLWKNISGQFSDTPVTIINIFSKKLLQNSICADKIIFNCHICNLIFIRSFLQKGMFYDPCRIKALNYNISNLDLLEKESKHVTATRTCTEWEYDTTTMGPTTVSQVLKTIAYYENIRSLTLKSYGPFKFTCKNNSKMLINCYVNKRNDIRYFPYRKKTGLQQGIA